MSKSIENVVVLGGSFNPPTIAHMKLLETAMNAVNADLGLFVPSSHNYVQKKMRKQGKEKQTLPFSIRQEMLEKMCKNNTKFQVDLSELGDDGKGHTYDTLVKIQDKYKSAKIYFVIGYDTIRMVPRWHSSDELLDKFYFVVFSRNGLSTSKELQNYEKLQPYRYKFIQAESPEGIEDISSTAVRDNINTNEDIARQMVDPLAYEILERYKSYFI